LERPVAFLDPRRVIARDKSHSRVEERFYCFGEVSLWRTYRAVYLSGGTIRIIGAGYWRRGKAVYEAQRKVQR